MRKLKLIEVYLRLPPECTEGLKCHSSVTRWQGLLFHADSFPQSGQFFPFGKSNVKEYPLWNAELAAGFLHLFSTRSLLPI